MSKKQITDETEHLEKKKKTPSQDTSVKQDDEEDDLDISDLVDKDQMAKADKLIEKYKERSGE